MIDGYPVQNMEMTIARNTYAMVVMAVVPFQKQLEEYDGSSSNSLDYDPASRFSELPPIPCGAG